MLVDPEKMLMRAQKDGLKFQRMGDAMNVEGPKSKLANWKDTLKQHKPALLTLLPDESQHRRPNVVFKGETYDLFGYDRLATVPTKPPHRSRRKTEMPSQPIAPPLECETQGA